MNNLKYRSQVIFRATAVITTAVVFLVAARFGYLSRFSPRTFSDDGISMQDAFFNFGYVLTGYYGVIDLLPIVVSIAIGVMAAAVFLALGGITMWIFSRRD